MASLTEVMAPGVHIQEQQDEISSRSDTIEGVDISTGACIGYFKKGKIGEPIEVNAKNFESILGGPIQNAYGYYSLKGYFDNGTDKAYVVRTAHYTDPSDPTTLTAKSSSTIITDRDVPDANETFKVVASSEGVWGDKVSFKIFDNPLVDTKLIEAAEAGATSIKVNSLNGVEVGLMLSIGNSYFKIKEYDNITKTIQLDGTIGTKLEIDAPISSLEFEIDVYDDSVLVEQIAPLDIREESNYYFETVVNEESSYIIVEDMFSDSTYPTNRPVSNKEVSYFLAGGDDGMKNLAVSDLKGDATAYTGIYAFLKTRDAFRLWCPESCAEELGLEMDKMCDAYKYAVNVKSVPESYSADEAIAFRKEVGCFDSSFGHLSDGWGYVNDPIGVGKNPKKLVPLAGHFLGMWARMTANNDISVIPAGEEALIYGVDSLERNITDTELALMNDADINCIIYIKRLGIVNWGGRTLSKDTKHWRYMNARAIFEYVEKSIQEGTRWAVFQPTVTSTWNRLTMDCNTFLNSVPGLAGDTQAERFVFICDASNNTADVIAEGKIVSDVGLNIEGVGEFVIFRVGHTKTVSSVSEEE